MVIVLLIYTMVNYVSLFLFLLRRGTAAAVPPLFGLGDPALCGSHPLITPY